MHGGEETVGCTGTTAKTTEWAYVASLRRREPDQCWGPQLRLTIPTAVVATLEHSFQDVAAFERLWGGLQPDHTELAFALCTGHWLDLSYLCGIHGRRYRRVQWTRAATDLLDEICHQAGWDAKEIANQMVWQRVLLT
jgi:hypothetical protein